MYFTFAGYRDDLLLMNIFLNVVYRILVACWLTNKANRLLYCNAFFPSVSNEVPEHPCVSPVSNQVFERRLIEKYIVENGTDPMNGQPLSEEQLIDIKGKQTARGGYPHHGVL